MEVGRIAIALGFFGIAGYGFFAFNVPDTPVTVREAALHRMGDALIFVGQIDNPGRADRLTGIGTEAAARSLLTGKALVVPASSTPSLAMDGVHGVIMGVHGDTSEGRLIPVSLWFERAGRVSTRARISNATMDHTQRHEVPEDAPHPSVAIEATATDSGWEVAVDVENFTFSQDGVDGPHEPGVGHGHLYLNGLKLQRLYSTTASVGALPPGQYQLKLTLNTNDHRAYSVAGDVVEAVTILTVN
ncbi:MAG: hypothetical protein AAGP08_04310 [Pseudomonadota bacterium]